MLIALLALFSVATLQSVFAGSIATFGATRFIAGMLEFVPYVGPIASAVPAIAVGLTEGGWTALWVVVLYIVIQQAESILLTPLIQRKAVDLPPGLIIFSILAFGILFGMGGVVLGTPLTVVAVILVKNFIRERDRRREVSKSEGDAASS